MALTCSPMQLIPFTVFAIAASGTPGPNNILVAASGARNGARATVPMVAGISLGFGLMIGVVGAGVSGVLAAVPHLDAVLRWVAFAWLVWLAVRVATAAPPKLDGTPRRGPGFWGMAAFQWVNPKAWLMALGTASAWIVPTDPMPPQLATIATVFALVTIPCVGAWALLGAAAGRLLRSPGRLRAFNVAMAVVLVASMLPVVLGR